ncbi:MAG: hypothetical protein QGI21_06910 [Candidatus Poseidoniaceae archaeon]|jgi:hypothetical protein|nr:hypothetical protein [Candidatus Poseidoniaceae archaeon]
MDEQQQNLETTPPPSIEISTQPSTFTGTPQLLGETQFNTQSPVGEIPLDTNITYQMGPDGQLIAVQKPPFSWKQFFIASGVPILLLLVPLILTGATNPGYYDDWDTEKVELIQQENTTSYVGSFELGEDRELEWINADVLQEQEDPECLGQYNGCWYNSQETNYGFRIDYEKCQWPEGGGESDCTITEGVGKWFSQNGTAVFDNGENPAEINFYFETQDLTISEQRDTADFFGAILMAACWIVPIVGLIFTIVGFASGRTGMGVGGVTGLALYPFVAFFGCIALLDNGW